MTKNKYRFTDLFYSDLDNPIGEEEKFKNFLFLDNNSNLFYISIVKNDSDKKNVKLNCNKNGELKKYIFIESTLAGVGINYFIIKSNYTDICKELEVFFNNMTLKYYYSDKWVDDLMRLDIEKLYKTDCDGDVLFIYEN